MSRNSSTCPIKKPISFPLVTDIFYMMSCLSLEYHFRHGFVLSLILTKYPKIITLYKTSLKVAAPLS